MKIQNIDIGRGLCLAPMESVTDQPFRIICKRLGADLVCTEFIASEALIRDNAKSQMKMSLMDEERPVAVQIFGGNIDAMTESAKIVEDGGADILDINLGCWVKKVVSHNAGAALLKNPPLMYEMVSSMVKAVSIPVTAKIRIGWDDNSIIILEVAKLLEDAGISSLAVHCRTRAMGMKGEADWSWIRKTKDVVSIPIILNGDIKTPEDAKRAYEETDCDGIMIGRAAIGNPFIFREIKALLETGTYIETATNEEKFAICLEHLKLTIEFKGADRAIKEFRKHYAGYLKGMYCGANLRQKLVLMESYEEIVDSFAEYKKFLEANPEKEKIQINETVEYDID